MRCAILLLFLCSCHPGEKSGVQLEPEAVNLPDSVRLLAPAAAQELIDNQPRLQVIDCRMDEEFQHGRLPGAYHVNYFHTEETRTRLETLDRQRPVLVYCALGARSRQTALLLLELGFQDISLLNGGLSAWLAAGLPLAK